MPTRRCTTPSRAGARAGASSSRRWREAAMAELALESRLAQAIREQEFVLHFQPQLALGDGALVGVEALLRWRHPQRGLLLPDDFIPRGRGTAADPAHRRVGAARGAALRRALASRRPGAGAGGGEPVDAAVPVRRLRRQRRACAGRRRRQRRHARARTHRAHADGRRLGGARRAAAAPGPGRGHRGRRLRHRLHLARATSRTCRSTA